MKTRQLRRKLIEETYLKHWIIIIGDYWIWNDDDSLDVRGTVNIDRSFNFTKLPVKFRKVTMDFNVVGIGLETFEGCPEIVGREFSCGSNNITTLNYIPKKVMDFKCHKNPINFTVEEIKNVCEVSRFCNVPSSYQEYYDLPEVSIKHKKLEELTIQDKEQYLKEWVHPDSWREKCKWNWNEDGSVDVEGKVHIVNYPLHKLPFKFNIVTGSFICNNNRIETLENFPNKIGHITKDIEGNDFIKSSFCFENNLIQTLDYFPKDLSNVDSIETYNNPGNFTNIEIRKKLEKEWKGSVNSDNDYDEEEEDTKIPTKEEWKEFITVYNDLIEQQAKLQESFDSILD